jgi:transcriptional regulator with XRE-family HTH domain
MNKDKYYLWVGKELKKYRKKNKLSLQDVADRIGVSFRQVKNYEDGVSKVTFPTMIELCELYGIDYRKFIEESIKQLEEE